MSVQKNHTLTNNQINRYGRHLVLPSFGVKAQVSLTTSSVLIVGIGGIGSSAALYLASSGVGTIGLLDHDHVDVSNLHRQIIHSEKNQGKLKVDSAAERLNELNSTCTYVKHPVQLTTNNAFAIVSKYDVVVDATDNVTARYILNDACVLANKPLVSGAAVSMDGQLSVYNYKNSPCYRCRFPRPPKRGNVASCSDAGVLGPVPGLIGVLQSIEAIKILSNIGECMNGRIGIFDAMDARFMVMKLNKRRETCEVCGDNNSNNINAKKDNKIMSLDDTLLFLQKYGLDNGMGEESSSCAKKSSCPLDNQTNEKNLKKIKNNNYINEAGKEQEGNNTSVVIDKFQHITCSNFYETIWKKISNINNRSSTDNVNKNNDKTIDVSSNEKILFLDVRAKHQYDICALPFPFQNIPYSEFNLQKELYFKTYLDNLSKEDIQIFTLCRRGIASQRAANKLVEWGFKTVINIDGGLEQWQKDVDTEFPLY